MVLDAAQITPERAVAAALRFIAQNEISVLNVAGPRASGWAGGYDFALQEPFAHSIVFEGKYFASALRVRGEEFDDGLEVDGVTVPVDRSALGATIGEKLLGLFFRDECNWAVPCRNGPRLVRSPALPDQTGDVEELADTRQESA